MEGMSGARTISHLPPRDVWLHDPSRRNKIPTPIDEHRGGVVDAEQLIKIGLESIDPSYDWLTPYYESQRKPLNDIHHLQWPKRDYYDPDGDTTARDFRNLQINLLNTPRVFHNWLHLLTEPAKVPEYEVMQHYIEAQRVVVKLFREAQIGKRILRMPYMADKDIEQHLIRRFDSFNETVEIGRALPPEYQLVDLSSYHGESMEEMFEPELMRRLGKKALISTVVRRVTQTAA